MSPTKGVMALLLVLALLVCCAHGIDKENFLKYLSAREDISDRCQTHLDALVKGLESGSSWAWSMIDAYGFIPKGIMRGNTNGLGFYDECLDVQQEIEGDTIKGRYCYAGLIVPLPNITAMTSHKRVQPYPGTFNIRKTIEQREENSTANSTFTPLLIGACVPDGCLPSELFGALGVDDYCETKHEYQKLDAGDISCLALFVVIAALAILSSIYDLYLHQNKKKAAHPLLLAFSVVTNGKKILQVSHAQGQILCFNGLKVISLFWVIVGHRFSLQSAIGIINYDDNEQWLHRWYTCYITMAPLAVDTFLFITGALTAFSFLKTMRRPKARFNILLYYLHRYLRLTPALAALYFFQVTLMRKISNGPQWQAVYESTRQKCLDASWSFFLYIQNYIQTSDKLCLIHTWYLSIDMQFFIVSPLVLFPMLKWPKQMAYFGLPLLTVLSILTPMLIIYFYDIQINTDDYYNLYYYVSHTRFTPWLIGIGFGAFMLEYQENKEKYKMNNKLLVLSIWVALFAVVIGMAFSQVDVAFNHKAIKAMFFLPLLRLVWGIFLSWVSYACLSGNSGPINEFLSMPFFQTTSKAMYSIYLIHGSLLVHYVGSMRTLGYFSDYESLYKATADIPIAVTFGTIWTLGFESPMVTIEKVIFGAGGGRRVAKSKKELQAKEAAAGENGRTDNSQGNGTNDVKIAVDDDKNKS